MDENLRPLIINIILTLLLVFVSIPLWNSSGSEKLLRVATAFDNLDIAMTIKNFQDIGIIYEKDEWSELEPTEIYLRNQNSYAKSCDLIMKISKDSTLDYENIYIAIDNKVYHLSELKVNENQNNCYYRLSTLDFSSYTDRRVFLRLWLEGNPNSDIDDLKLLADFITV